ncbi:MAG: hypothetical protein K9H48_07820 [Melioribacteraceae bacterium]|nr:hypothetical protein [Melioribacteraceae bacterium]
MQEDSFKKLDVDDNDLIVMKVTKELIKNKKEFQEFAESIRKAKQHAKINNPIIITPFDIEIERFPEKELNKAGYFKLTQEEKELLEK